MAYLLINEPPLHVIPTLACAVGLNEALVLQQVHYSLNLRKNKNRHQGEDWIYITTKKWHKDFSFWSKTTLTGAIDSLVNQDFLICKRIGQKEKKETLGYTINYHKLNTIEDDIRKNLQGDKEKEALNPYHPFPLVSESETLSYEHSLTEIQEIEKIVEGKTNNLTKSVKTFCLKKWGREEYKSHLQDITINEITKTHYQLQVTSLFLRDYIIENYLESMQAFLRKKENNHHLILIIQIK